jgi:outer membrane protein OmpA-like peptidoglycan-associated protein
VADRLVAKGFGESQPIVSDDVISKLKTSKEQEKAHQSNRRTEYKFLK